MSVATTSSMFNAVARHFEDPRATEALHLSVRPDDRAPVLLTAAQAWEALYGPTSDPALAAPVWRAALHAARSTDASAEQWQLLLIWLASPRLAGTVTRICRRLRADRADLEAEMVLSLLEGLQTGEDRSVDDLLRAARTRAWNHARAGIRETTSAALEHLADDVATPDDDPHESDPAQSLRMEVTRYGQTDGLRAELRFTISPGSPGYQALSALEETTGQRGCLRQAQDAGRRRHLTSGRSPRKAVRR
ncbi:hypothetical protein [Kitasatospora sp. MY 5-36]|uniref:hypothetical protein n=1 Tax=Kitasatospora sp. MY 5-36 TaxID=1678027 RepID=UPI000670AE80|nr:hypothetical protein [Kitasatospora sp. MY 5-36]